MQKRRRYCFWSWCLYLQVVVTICAVEKTHRNLHLHRVIVRIAVGLGLVAALQNLNSVERQGQALVLQANTLEIAVAVTMEVVAVMAMVVAVVLAAPVVIAQVAVLTAAVVAAVEQVLLVITQTAQKIVREAAVIVAQHLAVHIAHHHDHLIAAVLIKVRAQIVIAMK